MSKEKIQCPMCLFGSGFMPFTGRIPQTCTECEGAGIISKKKHSELKLKYGDLIT